MKKYEIVGHLHTFKLYGSLLQILIFKKINPKPKPIDGFLDKLKPMKNNGITQPFRI